MFKIRTNQLQHLSHPKPNPHLPSSFLSLIARQPPLSCSAVALWPCGAACVQPWRPPTRQPAAPPCAAAASCCPDGSAGPRTPDDDSSLCRPRALKLHHVSALPSSSRHPDLCRQHLVDQPLRRPGPPLHALRAHTLELRHESPLRCVPSCHPHHVPTSPEKKTSFSPEEVPCSTFRFQHFLLPVSMFHLYCFNICSQMLGMVK